MSKRSKRQHDLLAKRETGGANSDVARTAGEILRVQALRDTKTLGHGSKKKANLQRVAWGVAEPVHRVEEFPSKSAVADPGINALASFVLAAGLNVPAWCARTARYASGPIAEFMVFAESVKARRPQKRLPGWLSVARGRILKEPTDLGDDTIERLEVVRFGDPHTALRASRDALKQASGPSSVGRVLAIHASNLREIDELADALLALHLAVPALDTAGDMWGVGRALSTASLVVRACGNFALTAGLIDQCEMFYLRAGSRLGRASALAQRGALVLATGGDPRVALGELNAALAVLSVEGIRWRIAGVQQMRAAALLECGDFTGARAAISAAKVSTSPRSTTMYGRIVWRAAEIETAAGDHAVAEYLYLQAFDLITEPLCDRLLMATQVVRSATRQGEAARAVQAARRMLGSVCEPLELQNEAPTREFLRSAHRGLYLAALDAGMPVTVVKKAIGSIEST